MPARRRRRQRHRWEVRVAARHVATGELAKLKFRNQINYRIAKENIIVKCPIDGTELVMTDRSGIEIDYCPQCRGVWLDRGELDKIIERGAAQVQPPSPRQEPSSRPEQRYESDHRREDDDRRYHGGQGYQKKRKGLLGELFDF